MRHIRQFVVASAIVIAATASNVARCDDFERAEGDKAFAAKNYAQAVVHFTKSIQQDDTDHYSYHRRGQAHDKLKDYAAASADLSRAVTLQPDNATYLNGLAWFLATTPSPVERDGAQAVTAATRACEITEFKDAVLLDTLAAAHAEAGDFEKARQHELDAWNLCGKDRKGEFYSRLFLYRTNSPYRQGQVIRVTGPVLIRNNTTEMVLVRCRSYVDPSGKTIRPSATWQLKPGDSAHLAISGKRIEARSFEYTVQSSHGTTNWKSAAIDFDADGNLNLSIAKRDLMLAQRAPNRGAANARAFHAPSLRDEAIQRAILKILGAGLANELAKDQDRKNGLLAATLSVVDRRARDELIDSALNDVFPHLNDAQIRGTRRIISLYLDGDLSVLSLGMETAKEEIIEALKKSDPQLGLKAEVADFIYEVLKARAEQKRKK